MSKTIGKELVQDRMQGLKHQDLGNQIMENCHMSFILKSFVKRYFLTQAIAPNSNMHANVPIIYLSFVEVKLLKTAKKIN